MTRILLHIAVFVLLLQPGIAHAQYFLDDFEDGDPEDGNPVTWFHGLNADVSELEVIDGDFVVTTSGGVTSSFVEPPTSDVVVRAQLRVPTLSGGTYAIAGVGVRGQPVSAPAAYFGAVWADGRLRIGETSASGDVINARDTGSLFDPGAGDILLQFSVIGNKIALTAWEEGQTKPEAPQLTMFDDTLTSGNVVLFNDSDGPSTAAFRWFAAAPTTLAADFDLDADVDGNDFLIYQRGFSQFSGDATPGYGDADGNGVVNSEDFVIWQQEFGQSAIVTSAPIAVPEPSTLLFAVLGFVVLGGYYRRQ